MRRGVRLVLPLLLALLIGAVWAGDRVRCTTRWDAGLQVYRTECPDGSRAISTYDAGLQRWCTEVVKPPKVQAGKKGK